MREITQKIYTYDELTEKAKEKVKNEYREFFQECRNDFFYRDFVEELRQNGFKSLEPQYSLGYHQGDGCSVIGKIYLNEVLENKDIMENFSKDEIRRLKYIDSEVRNEIKIENNSNHYYHANTMSFYANVYVNTYTHGKNYDLMVDVFDKLEGVLEDYFMALCNRMEVVGYEVIYDEEGIEEELMESDYEYYKDGTRYWGK